MTLISVLLVPLIDLINARVKDSQLRFWISVLVCIVVGIVINVLTFGKFTSVDLIAADILKVFAMVQLVYKGIYEGGNMQAAIRSTATPDSPPMPPGIGEDYTTSTTTTTLPLEVEEVHAE